MEQRVNSHNFVTNEFVMEKWGTCEGTIVAELWQISKEESSQISEGIIHYKSSILWGIFHGNCEGVMRLLREILMQSSLGRDQPLKPWARDSKRIGLELLKKALGFLRTSGQISEPMGQGWVHLSLYILD